MTTTGEQLASLSGLPSGTAMAHLLAITTGGGTGETIYASTMHVVTSTPQVFAQRISRRKPVEREYAKPAAVSATNEKRKTSRAILAYVSTPPQVSYPFTQAEEVFVSMRQAQTVVVHTAGNSVVARRRKA